MTITWDEGLWLTPSVGYFEIAPKAKIAGQQIEAQERATRAADEAEAADRIVTGEREHRDFAAGLFHDAYNTVPQAAGPAQRVSAPLMGTTARTPADPAAQFIGQLFGTD